MADRLRALWDFDDLAASEGRLRAQLARETTDAGRAEVLTQLARLEGLRNGFDDCARLLAEAEELAGDSAVARARVDLEQGRRLRSSGDPAAARPLFEAAFERAREAGEEFVAVDAAHMAALVAGDEGMLEWTQRGIELAEASSDPAVGYWLGPLFNNLGWARYEAGDHGAALPAFERALEARERDPDRPYEREIARYAVGKALRALGRAAEAAPLLEQALAWAADAGIEDGWFHEELAEDYAALGRDAEAREQARKALRLVDAGDAERLVRLRVLAR